MRLLNHCCCGCLVTNDGRVVPLRLDSRVHWRAWVSRAELANWWPCMSAFEGVVVKWQEASYAQPFQHSNSMYLALFKTP